MTERPKLTEILGVERGEIFGIETYAAQFCINDAGFFISTKDPIELPLRAELVALCRVLNGELKIIRKPRFNDEEMTVLRWLHKHARLKRLCKDELGVTDAFIGGTEALGCNIAYYLLKPGEMVNLDEMFKEDTDND